jgi:hypothetical protein
MISRDGTRTKSARQCVQYQQSGTKGPKFRILVFGGDVRVLLYRSAGPDAHLEGQREGGAVHTGRIGIL